MMEKEWITSVSVEGYEEKEAVLRDCEKRECLRQNWLPRSDLFQGLPKGDKMELDRAEGSRTWSLSVLFRLRQSVRL